MKTDHAIQTHRPWVDGFRQRVALPSQAELFYLETAFGGVVPVYRAECAPAALASLKILPWLVVVSVVGTWAVDTGTLVSAQEASLNFPSSQDVEEQLAQLPTNVPPTPQLARTDPEKDLLTVPNLPSEASTVAWQGSGQSGAPIPNPEVLVKQNPHRDVGILNFEPPPVAIPERENMPIAQAKPDDLQPVTSGIQNVPEMWVLFEGGTDSLVAKAVGAAEGTRTPQGDRTPAYFGHIDPGNQVWNLGTFSYQHGANSPEEADLKQLQRLAVQTERLQQQAIARGMSLTLAEKLNGIDLANQAPKAALSEIGYVKWLQKAREQGLTGEEAIVWARVQSFIDPQTGTWDAPGLGNDAEFIERDQRRRFHAIRRAIASHPQTLPIAQAQPDPAAEPASAPVQSIKTSQQLALKNSTEKNSPDRSHSLWTRLANRMTSRINNAREQSLKTKLVSNKPPHQPISSQLGAAPEISLPENRLDESAAPSSGLLSPPGLTSSAVDGSVPQHLPSTLAQGSGLVQPPQSLEAHHNHSFLGEPLKSTDDPEENAARIIFQDVEPEILPE